MSFWKKLFGKNVGSKEPAPKQAKSAQPRKQKSLEEIRAELEVNRVTLDKANAPVPKIRVVKPADSQLWKPVYTAACNNAVKPTDLTRSEAICFLVGAAALHYESDGIDNGLLGNFGEEELSAALPAIDAIGAQPVAELLKRLLTEVGQLRDLPTDTYFKRLEQYEEELKVAGIDELLAKLNSFLSRNYQWG